MKILAFWSKISNILLRTRQMAENEPAERLYREALHFSRLRVFYQKFKIADTLDGRFDMLCLVVSLVMRRIKMSNDERAGAYNQKLFDIFFADMDLTLREMGVGDLGVAKRIRKMSEAYMGRLNAYEKALQDSNQIMLATALARNIGRRDTLSEEDKQLSIFVRQVVDKLAKLDDHLLFSGEVKLESIIESAFDGVQP